MRGGGFWEFSFNFRNSFRSECIWILITYFPFSSKITKLLMNKFYVFTSPFYSSLWDGNRNTKLNRTDLNLKPKLSVTFKIFVVLTLGSDERQLAQLVQTAGTKKVQLPLIQQRLRFYGFTNKYGLAVLSQPSFLPWLVARDI